jgi:hypothetical protein
VKRLVASGLSKSSVLAGEITINMPESLYEYAARGKSLAVTLAKK